MSSPSTAVHDAEQAEENPGDPAHGDKANGDKANGDKARRDRWWKRHRATIDGVMFSLIVFSLSRVLITGAIILGARIIPGKDMAMAFLSWDAGWYYAAANDGYPRVLPEGTGEHAQNTIAYFPLYPLLIRLVQSITGMDVVPSGILVAVSAGACATVALWFLARRLADARTANIAVALFCFFPGSITMLLLMAESVMLVFAIGCMLALLDRRWLIAGVCAALATAARPTALVLIGCCVWAAGMAIWERREWRSLIAPILAPAGILGYFTFLWHHTGNFFAWFHVEMAGWGYGETERFASLKPITSLLNPLENLDRTMTAIALLCAITGLAFMVRWKPPMVLFIFAIGLCLLAFGTGGPASKLRYVWSIFPFAIAAAYWARDDQLRFTILLGTFALSLGMFALLSVHSNLAIL